MNLVSFAQFSFQTCLVLIAVGMGMVFAISIFVINICMYEWLSCMYVYSMYVTVCVCVCVNTVRTMQNSLVRPLHTGIVSRHVMPAWLASN